MNPYNLKLQSGTAASFVVLFAFGVWVSYSSKPQPALSGVPVQERDAAIKLEMDESNQAENMLMQPKAEVSWNLQGVGQ